MKKIKRLSLAGLSLLSLVALSGCVRLDSDGNPSGMVWNIIGKPMARLIQFFANDWALGFGVAIILVTLIVRFIILPLGIYQSWKASYQSEKREYLKPILGPIQERMQNASSQEEQLQAQQELLSTQKEYGVSMLGGMGCLPLLIQLPFFSALFYAARYTEGVADATYFGINLGERSYILIALAGLLYLAQSLFMQVGMDPEQRKQMRTMVFMNPIMIVMFSWNTPASVTLYWVVGGLFGILQQAITTFIIKPYMKKKVADEFAENPPKPLKTATKPIKDVTPTANSAISSNNKKRNAGKQNRK